MFSHCSPPTPGAESATKDAFKGLTWILTFDFPFSLLSDFSSKWHKSQHNLILKDTNSYFLFSICPKDKRKTWSLNYSWECRTLKLLKEVRKHTHVSNGDSWDNLLPHLSGVRNKQNKNHSGMWGNCLMSTRGPWLWIITFWIHQAHLLRSVTKCLTIFMFKWGKS